MKKRVLTRTRVVEEAAALADDIGLEALTIALLAARLDVKAPSLYNHVDGLPALRRELLLLALRETSVIAGKAVMGKTGRQALHAMAVAMRAFARRRPGLYAATSTAHPVGDAEVMAAGREALYPLEQVLANHGLQGDAAIHALRMLRSSIHGFLALEAGGFGLPVNLDSSFEWMVQTLATALGLPET